MNTPRSSPPAARVLSLGAGVQSTTIALLAAAGRIPPVEHAVFSDTGWEPRAVYEHLERVRVEVLEPAGIELHVVSNGNIYSDTVGENIDGSPAVEDRRRRFAALPFHLLNPSGEPGMGRRQCTSEYKLTPIRRKVRELLGAPLKESGVPGRVPGRAGDRYVEQLIGISTDEAHRARDSDVLYAVNGFPLLDLGWTRRDCLRYLERVGWESTPKSACVGCPFHGNKQWRELRDNAPADWQSAVTFDRKLREPGTLQYLELEARPFLHASRIPLDEAPIDKKQRSEGKLDDLLDVIRDIEWDEAEEPPGCSPFACRNDDGFSRAEPDVEELDPEELED